MYAAKTLHLTRTEIVFLNLSLSGSFQHRGCPVFFSSDPAVSSSFFFSEKWDFFDWTQIVCFIPYISPALMLSVISLFLFSIMSLWLSLLSMFLF